MTKKKKKTVININNSCLRFFIYFLKDILIRKVVLFIHYLNCLQLLIKNRKEGKGYSYRWKKYARSSHKIYNEKDENFDIHI